MIAEVLAAAWTRRGSVGDTAGDAAEERGGRSRGEEPDCSADGIAVRAGWVGVRLLQVIPAGGCRIVDLSAELRVSSQGLGRLVKHLEREGYLSLAPDPTDRRAKLLHSTTAGDKVVARVAALLDSVEQTWRAEIGPARFDIFREVLAELAAEFP